jgi:hypothetical protein
MLFTMKPRTAIAIAGVSWLVSLWLASNSGLALIVHPNGEKYCVDGLSLYFGFSETNTAVAALSTVSVLLALAIPLGLAAFGAVRLWRKRKAKTTFEQ